MRHRPIQKSSILFLSGGILLCVCSFIYLSLAGTGLFSQTAQSDQTISLNPLPSCKQQTFQTGVAFPQWSSEGYGASDTKWLSELSTMRKQTAACWLEIPILFFQDTPFSTDLKLGASTSTVDNLTYGIHAAHKVGYHVFLTPLVTITDLQPSWAGAIQFSTFQQEQQWFASYWQILKPYVAAAAQAGVEQLSIGTEEDWLQSNAPASLWNGLIANVRSVFTAGSLTYDTNWSKLQNVPPVWMQNADLKMIGVSAYLSLVETPVRVDPKQIAALWKKSVKPPLDAFARKLGKPIFLSEVGYRNSSDALYHSWESTSSAPADPEEQAAACDAALVNSISDSHILGSFFWGWDDVDLFSLKGHPAVTILHNRYAPLQGKNIV